MPNAPTSLQNFEIPAPSSSTTQGVLAWTRSIARAVQLAEWKRPTVNVGWDDVTGFYRSLTSTLTNRRFVRLT